MLVKKIMIGLLFSLVYSAVAVASDNKINNEDNWTTYKNRNSAAVETYLKQSAARAETVEAGYEEGRFFLKNWNDVAYTNKEGKAVVLKTKAVIGSKKLFPETAADLEKETKGLGFDDCDDCPKADPSGLLSWTAFESDHWEVALGAIYYIERDKSKKIINLEETDVNRIIKSENEIAISDLQQSLKFNNDSSRGYKVEVFLKADYGLGLGVTLDTDLIPGLGTIGVHVGVMPFRGRVAISKQFVLDVGGLTSLRQVKLPYEKEDAEIMSFLDAVSWETHGGIVFSVGIDSAIGGISKNYLAKGLWRTDVVRLDANKVYAKTTKGKLRSLSTVASTPLGIYTLSKNKFRDADNSFSFIFNLDNEDAYTAYNQMLKGSMLAAEEMAAKKDGAVIRIITESDKAFGTIRSRQFRIPFWMKKYYGTGRVRGEVVTENHPDKSVTTTAYGIAMADKKQKFGGTKINRNISYYGANYEKTDAQGQISNGVFSQYIWNFDHNKATVKTLTNELRRLVKKTGLKNELALADLGEQRALGQLSVKLLVDIPKEATELLMSIVTNEKTTGLFERLSTSFADQYFEKTTEIDGSGICRGFKKLRKCQRVLTRRAKYASATMVASLEKMAQNQDSDKKEFSKAYARFGRAMSTNAFSFQTIYNLLKGRGLSMVYHVSGPNISVLNKGFQWIPEVQ